MNCVSGNVNVCFGGEFDLFDDVGSDDRPLTSTIFKRGIYLCIELRIRVIFKKKQKKSCFKFLVKFRPDFVEELLVVVYYLLILILKMKFFHFSSNVHHY
jgi:hypothetical protein